VKHFRVFGSKCYIKREDGRMGKFDSCVDKGILVGYSITRKAYKCYNIRLNKVVEHQVTMMKQAENQRKKKTNQWNKFSKKNMKKREEEYE
jgi:hypothetical protein